MKNELPLSARLLILAVAAGGLAMVILRILDTGRWNEHDLLAWAALMIGIVLAEQFTIPIRFRTETLNFSVTEGVWIAALILGRASVLTLAVAFGILVGNTLRRWAPYKMAFNVGQFVAAMWAEVSPAKQDPAMRRLCTAGRCTRSRASTGPFPLYWRADRVLWV